MRPQSEALVVALDIAHIGYLILAFAAGVWGVWETFLRNR